MSPRKEPKPAPERPWRRAEAGRHRSSDERFTIAGEAAGRWFLTDEQELDELGLARTSGPYPTLEAAKAAADGIRDRGPAVSPLAARLEAASSRPASPRPAASSRPASPRPGEAAVPRPAPAGTRGEVDGTVDGPAEGPVERPGDGPVERPAARPAPSPRSWLDELRARDAAAATRARRLIAALERDGMQDADAVVRRDVLGGDPAIATRLLAREIEAAIERVTAPDAIARLAASLPAASDPVASASALARLVAMDLTSAVAEVVARGGAAGLPGWELVERRGPDGRPRSVRLGTRGSGTG